MESFIHSATMNFEVEGLMNFQSLFNLSRMRRNDVTLYTANESTGTTIEAIQKSKKISNIEYRVFIGSEKEFRIWKQCDLKKQLAIFKNEKRRATTIERCLILLNYNTASEKIYGQLPVNFDISSIQTVDLKATPRAENDDSYRVFIGQYGSLKLKSDYDAYFYLGHNVELRNEDYMDVFKKGGNVAIYDKDTPVIPRSIMYYTGSGLDNFIDSLVQWEQKFTVYFVTPIEEWLVPHVFSKHLLQLCFPHGLFSDVGDWLIDRIHPDVSLKSLLINGKFLVALNYSGNRVIKNVFTRRITFKYYAAWILKNAHKLTPHKHAKAFLASYFSEVGEDMKVDIATHHLFKVYTFFWFIKIDHVKYYLDRWRTYKSNHLINMKSLLMHLETKNLDDDDDDYIENVKSIFKEFLNCVKVPMIEKLACCLIFLLNNKTKNTFWFLGSDYDRVLKEDIDSKYSEYYEKLIRNINFAYKDPFNDILKDATFLDVLILSTRFASKLRNSIIYLLIKLPVVPAESLIECLSIHESVGEEMLKNFTQQESLDFCKVISCNNPYFLNVHECVWNYLHGKYVPSTCSFYDEVCRVFAEYEIFDVIGSYGKIYDSLLEKMFDDLKPDDYDLLSVEEQEQIKINYADTVSVLCNGISELYLKRLSTSILDYKHGQFFSLNDIEKMAPYGTEDIRNCFVDLICNGILPLDIRDTFISKTEDEINCQLNHNENLLHTSAVNRRRILFRMASRYQTESKKNKKVVIPPGKELLYAIISSTNGINIRKLNLQKLFVDAISIEGEPKLLGLSYFEIISDEKLREIIAKDIEKCVTTNYRLLNIYLLNLNMTCNYKFVLPKYIECK